MNCSKCSTAAPDTARFCPRCHATLLFTCPSCTHEQQHAGTCDECGVDFMKYIAAVVAAKKDQAAAAHARVEERSSLVKDILLLPFNMGIPLLRRLIEGSRRNS